ncbi:MAG: hypothetical protein LQ346_003960 [Caloplaca aetnensis]|nr:MAG: hypothetical protein LQ346_003960 [Caloplaca aetnensis]
MNLNRKDTPAPFSRSVQSPPRTPRNPRAGSRRASGPHKTPRDVYVESRTENARGADGDDTTPNNRISHDLSLTANTGRSSVVDSMLMSLNPDQPKFESPPYTSNSRFTSPESPRSRGHLPSSSLNSDYSFPSPSSDPRPDSHRSTQHPHGRRSNSSNFHSLSRIDSLTTDDEKADTRRARAYQSQRAGLGGRTPLPPSRSGRKSSKSSGSSSVDFGQMMRQPTTAAKGRRSASFDDGRRRPSLPNATSMPQPVIFHNIEAAPTPTVPSGPRSPANMSSAPPPLAPAPTKKSFRYQGAKKSKAGPSKVPTGQKPEVVQDFPQTLHQAPKELRPPSPTKEYDDRLGPHDRPQSQARDNVKERPGFFRRVFMSSRNASLTSQDVPQPEYSRSSVRADSNAFSTQPRSTRSSKAAIFGEANHAPRVAGPPPLAKKPSSFFRRRKKSVSENIISVNPVPTAYSDPHPSAPTMRSNPSTSSLRELMNPYLSSSPDARKGSVVSQSDTAHKSTGIPVEKSKVKPVFSQPFTHTSSITHTTVTTTISNNKPSSRARQIEESISKSAPSASREHDTLLQAHDKSFLHDNSSNETRLIATAPSAPDVAGSMPMNERVYDDSMPSKPHPSSHDEQAPFNDGSIEAARPIVDFVQKPNRRKPRNAKPNRSRAASGETFSMTESIEHPTSPTAPDAQLTVVAAAAADERSPRVWLRPEKSAEDLRKLAEESSAAHGAEASQDPGERPASSRRPRVPIEIQTASEMPTNTSSDPKSPDFDATLPFREDRVLAQRVYEGDEDLVAKPKAAAWLGEAGPDRARVRRAYMELFDWQSLNILAALRDFCGRLLLKGETQQVDRILDAFSSRWCACNANHGFKATDVVHTICYSILLLNTDLHVADIEQKMTRAQFIKNTLPTIRRVAADAAPEAFESKRASTLPTKNWAESPSGRSGSPTLRRESSEGRRSYEGPRPSYRLSSRPSDQAAQVVRLSESPTPLDYDAVTDDCGPLVKTPFHGKMSTWEVQIEIVLKDFFNSIRQERLPLHRFDDKESAEPPPPASHSLSAITSNMLRRTPSMLSKAGSEHTSFRGRPTESRLGTGKWTSKGRSRPRLYPSSTMGSSRTSLEDQSSAWTPSGSSTWSKYSLSKTQTSMSVNSYSSSFPSTGYQQSIGFANALSQAIIREEGVMDPSEDTLKALPLLEDESLELAGAPWAKEGILKHKHHLEAMDKKSKDRNWVESFAVIERGWMRLFSFNMNAKSMRVKAKHQKALGGVVGGGNWMDSAEDLGKFLLRQTIASALPPPGYSKARPHVWALSLPNGAVHLFQVGTPDIVKEFVTTANYWSARLSKEPLVGGVSNIEYGWSESVINSALLQQENHAPSNVGNARPSLQNSIRSSLDQGSVRPKLPGDRTAISDWTPPQQSMVASVLLEVDQLRALTTYVKNIEEELQKHNELRGPMSLAFSLRHPNSFKAMANWERKSSYLLKEIVKFTTYIDCLQAAQAQKEGFHASKKALTDEKEDNATDTAPAMEAAPAAPEATT